MAAGPLQQLLRQLQRMLGAQGAGALPDVQLLERFLHQRDEAAFEGLLWRHGPLVWNVCQRVLRRQPDVEDAFQATFLMLIRKGGSIRGRQALGSWLYKVAYRIALEARTAAARRATREQQSARSAVGDTLLPSEEAGRRELQSTLDEAIAALPEKYRTPLILCYFEGKTYEAAAQELDCPKGTISIRLTRARELLRHRLERRGISVSLAALTATLSQDAASAAVPSQLVKCTITAALWFAARKAAAVGVVSEQVVRLVKGVSRAMFIARLKLVAAVVVAVVAQGVILWSYGARADDHLTEPPNQTRTATAAPRPEQAKAGGAADEAKVRRAAGVMAVFIAALKDPDPVTRGAAAKGLNRLGPATFPALVEVLKGKDQKLTVAAVQVLAGMQVYSDSSAPTLLRQALEHALKDKKVLAEVMKSEDWIPSPFGSESARQMNYSLVKWVLGTNAIRTVIEFLKADDVQLRRGTIGLLGSMGGTASDALPVLTDMFPRTTNRDERHELLEAITNIAAPPSEIPAPAPPGIRGKAGGKGKGGKSKRGD
jgi:RNA polymerase sigma factor (sigma-70 family)